MNKKQKKHKKNRNKNNKEVSIKTNVESDSIKLPSDSEIRNDVSSIQNSTDESQSRNCEIKGNIETFSMSICNNGVNNEVDKPITPPTENNIISSYENEILPSVDSSEIIKEIRSILNKIDKTPEANELQKKMDELDLWILSLQNREKEKEKKFNDEINGLKEEIFSLSNLLKAEKNPLFSIDSIINPPLSYNSCEINQLIYSQNSNNENNVNNLTDSYSLKSNSSSSSSSSYSTYDSDADTSEGYDSDELLNEIQKYMPNNLNLREILPPKNIDELIEIESRYGFKLLEFDRIDVEIYSEEEEEDDDDDEDSNKSEKKERKNRKADELELCFLDRINIIYNKNLNQSKRPTPIPGSRSKSRRYIEHYNSNDKKKKKKSPSDQVNINKYNNNNNKYSYKTPNNNNNNNNNNNSFISPPHLSSSIVNDNCENDDDNDDENENNSNNQRNSQYDSSNYNLIDVVNGLEYSFNNSISIINERDITKELIEKNELSEYKDKELKLQAERLGNRVYDSESDTMSTTSENSTGSGYMNSLLRSTSSSPLPFFDDDILLSNENVKKQINEKMNEVNNTPFKVIKEELYPRSSQNKFRQPNFNKEFEDEKCRINHFLTYSNNEVEYNFVYNLQQNEIEQNEIVFNPVISIIEIRKEEESDNNIFEYDIIDYLIDEDDNSNNDNSKITVEDKEEKLNMIFYKGVDIILNFEEMFMKLSEEYNDIIDNYKVYIEFSSLNILFDENSKGKEIEKEKEIEVKPSVEDEKEKKIKLLERQVNALKKVMSLNLKKSKYNRLIVENSPVYSLEFQVYEHILSLSNVECFNYTSHYVEKDVEIEDKEEEDKKEEDGNDIEEDNLNNENENENENEENGKE